MVICPDCGKEVKDAKFCSNCGSLLPKAEEVVSEKVEESVDVHNEDGSVEVKSEVDDVPAVEEESVKEAVDEEVVEEKSEDVVNEVAADESVEESVDVPEEAAVDEVIDDSADEEPVKEETEETIDVAKKSKFCPNCGTEVSQETVFCPQCGFRLKGEETPQTKFCQNCGKKIDINAEICPHCGVRVARAPSSEEKNVLLAAILSFIFPGLGHLYLGLNTKAVSFIIAYIVSGILVIFLIGIVLMLIVWLWALVDSIKSTEAINRGDYVEDKLF